MYGSGVGSRRGIRRMAFLAAGSGLVALMFAGGAGPSRAAECPPDRLLCRLFSSPTTTPTTPTTQPVPIVTTATVPPVAVLPPAPVAPHSVPGAAQRLLDLANSERAKAGLGPLVSRDDVVDIAIEHSFRMAAEGTIFHNDVYFSDAVKRLLNSKARGENVAQNSSIDDTHTRLMNSPGHRANLLDPRFSVVGFAVVQATDGRYYTTQDFLQPAGAGVPATPAAAAPPAPRKPATSSAGAAVASPAPPQAPVEPPAVEETALTTGTAAGGSPRLAHLADANPLPASSTRPRLPGRPSPETWLTAGLLLALVALGTVQVGRGAARSVATTR